MNLELLFAIVLVAMVLFGCFWIIYRTWKGYVPKRVEQNYDFPVDLSKPRPWPKRRRTPKPKKKRRSGR